ncbi:MAG: RNA polymerase sigma factor [Spirochaetes bacterium]|jgi:RNA polymerase sigma-70 factor (ECF subfamily)|nr:RNA polymerase sigma factor [Spirochaetota bacterium]
MLNFDEIYTEYHEKILRYLKGIVGGEMAEDLTQEVFIKVSRTLDSLKDESSLSSWLYKIALNTARDSIRSTRRIVSVKPLAAADGSSGADLENLADKRHKSHDDAIMRKEMVQCYVEFVKKLPSNYYDIYVLSEFDGLSNEEISDRLSLSIETVKIRLHRARVRLYEELRKGCTSFYTKDGELLALPRDNDD